MKRYLSMRTLTAPARLATFVALLLATAKTGQAQQLTVNAPEIAVGTGKPFVVSYRGVIRETTPPTTATVTNTASASGSNFAAVDLANGVVVIVFEDFVIANPAYMLWNGFLSMLNVSAVINKDPNAIFGAVTLRDSEGAATSILPVGIAGGRELDILVNNLPGFSPQGVGLVELQFDRSVFDGNGMLYRFSPGSGSVLEFELGGLLQNPLYGESSAIFNTMQPSHRSGQENFEVSNWLQLANLGSAPLSFSVQFYSSVGTLVQDVSVTVPPLGRRDIPGGHIIPGKNRVGTLLIRPGDSTVPYLAQLARYGSSSDTAALAKFYYFAQLLEARPAAQTASSVPIYNSVDSQNWVAISNPTGSPGDYVITFRGNNGAALANVNIHLEPCFQQHIFANVYLGALDGGVATITPVAGSVYIAESNVYYYDLATGETTGAYGVASRVNVGTTIDGSYNTFIGQENNLAVFNQSSFLSSSLLQLFPLGSTNLALANFTGASFDLQGLSFGPLDDTVGTISLSGLSGQNLANVVRLQKAGNGRVNGAEILPLR